MIKEKPDGTTKVRACIDYRDLNEHLDILHVRFQHINYMKNRRDIRNAYFISLDMENAFHHLCIHPEFRHFMRFSTETGPNVETEIFEPISMPFGEKGAPMRLTKLMFAPVRFWTEQGMNIAIYIDDLLLWNLDPDLLQQQGQRVLTEGTEKIGITWSNSRCELTPKRLPRDNPQLNREHFLHHRREISEDQDNGLGPPTNRRQRTTSFDQIP